MKMRARWPCGAVPNLVQQTKDVLLQKTSTTKDLKGYRLSLRACRSREGNQRGMAKIYVTSFRAGVEGPRYLLQVNARPEAYRDRAPGNSVGMSYMNQWAQAFAEVVNGQFRAEMRKRGKEI